MSGEYSTARRAASGGSGSATAATGAPSGGTTARWSAKTVDPAVARLSPEQLEALGPTSSNIIKLASHDPRLSREARERGGGTFVVRYANGRPRVAGDYDADGLRVGVWRFWYEDGKLAREVEYLGGVREHAAREWHPNGAPAVEGFYVAGEREGRWRWWDATGRLTGEAAYSNGTPARSEVVCFAVDEALGDGADRGRPVRPQDRRG